MLFFHCRLIIILSIYVWLTLTLAKVCPHSCLITLLIDLILLLAHSQNSNATIILMSNWLTYLVILQTNLLLIKLLILILIQEKLKPIFLTLSVALSLISFIISYFNIVFISTPIPCNLI